MSKKKKPKLTLIKNELTLEQRMQHRINALRRDLMQGEGEIEYTNAVLNIVYDYLCEYEDEDVLFAAVKVKEGIFYLDNFIRY